MSLLLFRVTSCRINKVTSLLIIQLISQAFQEAQSFLRGHLRCPCMVQECLISTAEAALLKNASLRAGESVWRVGPHFPLLLHAGSTLKPGWPDPASLCLAAVIPMLGRQQDAEMEGKARSIPVECTSVVQEAAMGLFFSYRDT